uniref:Zinc finger AN1-type containing 3 n=1 Tax=Labrus bergylta TaxID=56723 RepID=A0A3Q3E4Q6_9LABR
MGDTSERSKAPSLPPRCPCGFWGFFLVSLSLTLHAFLLSYFYIFVRLLPLLFFTTDIQKKQPGEDCTSKPIQSTGSSSQSPVFSSETSSSSSQSPLSSSPPSSSEQPSAEESSPTFPSMREASGSESEATPEKRPRTDEQQQQQQEEEEEGSSEEARGTPKQKNRRRCYRCQTKLELVQQELGSCRCGYVFCMLHRLPEQHDCLFDHLGRGREEAVLKMVKLDRKVGRSCQRIGEECS